MYIINQIKIIGINNNIIHVIKGCRTTFDLDEFRREIEDEGMNVDFNYIHKPELSLWGEMLGCVVTGKFIKIPKGQSPCESCKRDDDYLQCLNCKDYSQYQSESIWDDE